MRKREYYIISFIIAIAILGLWLRGYLGGMMTGAGIATAILVYIGKRSANKAAQQLEKYIRDQQLYK